MARVVGLVGIPSEKSEGTAPKKASTKQKADKKQAVK